MRAETSSELRPFRLDVADETLADLKRRLESVRLPGEVDGSDWTYGTNLAYLRELIAYWRDQYDWREQERKLNALPQFLASVDGQELHFVHARGKGPNPLPLLMCHGWPGSFYEMAEVIGPLSDPAAYGGDAADAFDVVVPSLPGYGFSPDPHRPGVTPAVMGDLFTSLMRDVLGYRRFGTQGGDWGGIITQQMGFRHPDALIGIHLNFLVARPPAGPDAPALTDEEQAAIAAAGRWREEEAGYQQIQGTRPQTLAYALTDSPTGLAAWIVEKFRAWSDCDGDVERAFSKDQLLTNVMIYWLSGCIGSSMRLYYESRHHPWAPNPGERSEVPVGFAAFPKEIGMASARREWAERTLNIQRWTTMPKGGHFAAMERPQLLVDDVRAFFRPLRG